MKILFTKKFICILIFANAAFSEMQAYGQQPDQPTNIDPPNGQTNLTGKVSMKISDPNGDILTVKLYGRIKKTDSNFTIIGLPDTQFYTEEPQGQNSGGGGSNAIFKSQTNWIAQHLRDSNIVFVTQLGDCVQNGDANEVEWKRADTAMKNIENPNVALTDGIAYGICAGNHDQSPTGSQSGTTTFFNQYFGAARFTGRGYYGGHYGVNNDNHYELFSAGGTDFIHISLEYNPNSLAADQTALQDVLNWADALLKTYGDRKGILSSHWLMGTGTQTAFQGPGQKVYDDLKDNPNLVLMLCGHVSGEGRRTDVFNGSTVHTLMSDYQSGYGNGGDGLLRIMQFIPADNLLSVKTFSPWKNNQAGGFLTGAGSEFTLPVNIKTFPLVGTNTGVASESTTSFTWNGLLPETTYEWYVTIEDGTGITTSSTFEFNTPGVLPVNLIRIEAVIEKQYVRLDWSTATESNSNYFEVERSGNGSSFTKIGTVKAKGNSGIVSNYSLYDKRPLNGKSFYRLKMVDNDEKFTYSKTVAVTGSSVHRFEIVPNPSMKNEIRFVYADENKNVRVNVYDISGRLCISKNISVNGQVVVIKHQLVAGIYNIEVQNGRQKETRRINIQ